MQQRPAESPPRAMQLTRAPRGGPAPLYSTLSQPPAPTQQPRACRGVRPPTCAASGGSAAQQSGRRRPGNLELRRASGGWASTSADTSSRRGCGPPRRQCCRAAEEEDLGPEISYSDEVLTPGSAPPGPCLSSAGSRASRSSASFCGLDLKPPHPICLKSQLGCSYRGLALSSLLALG